MSRRKQSASRTSHPGLPPRLRFRALRGTQQDAEYALALGAFISICAWHHFATLTCDRGTSADQLIRWYHDRFIRRLAHKAARRVDHFYAIERDQRTGRFAHVHALLYGTDSLTVQEMRQLWPHGFTHVSPYDRRSGAAHYVVKDLLVEEDSYNWSRVLPPRLGPWEGPVENEFRATVAAMKAGKL